MNRTIYLLVCLLLVSVTSVFTQTEKFPTVQIRGSQIRTLKSIYTGRTYDLYLQLPNLNPAGKKYPVLFILDGQWDFKLLDSVYGGLHYDGFVPEMIIVGITYSGENPNYDKLRAMDYTPTPEAAHKGSGDAAKFLKFLKTQVFPLVEKDYNADSEKRILMGSSLGGLFTLYAMLSEPNLFYGYVSASPAVTWDKDFSYRHEKEFAGNHKDLPVRLFISVGGVESLTEPVKKYFEILKKRSYNNLKLETRVIEGERHAGNKPEAFNRGLRFIFNDN